MRDWFSTRGAQSNCGAYIAVVSTAKTMENEFVQLLTDKYGPVWLLVAGLGWFIWWLMRRFLQYLGEDIAQKQEIALALRELNDRLSK